MFLVPVNIILTAYVVVSSIIGTCGPMRGCVIHSVGFCKLCITMEERLRPRISANPHRGMSYQFGIHMRFLILYQLT